MNTGFDSAREIMVEGLIDRKPLTPPGGPRRFRGSSPSKRLEKRTGHGPSIFVRNPQTRVPAGPGSCPRLSSRRIPRFPWFPGGETPVFGPETGLPTARPPGSGGASRGHRGSRTRFSGTVGRKSHRVSSPGSGYPFNDPGRRALTIPPPPPSSKSTLDFRIGRAIIGVKRGGWFILEIRFSNPFRPELPLRSLSRPLATLERARIRFVFFRGERGNEAFL
jgi:hypothetical protein